MSKFPELPPGDERIARFDERGEDGYDDEYGAPKPKSPPDTGITGSPD